MKVQYFISQFEHRAQSTKLEALIQQTFDKLNIDETKNSSILSNSPILSKFLVVWYEYFYAIVLIVHAHQKGKLPLAFRHE